MTKRRQRGAERKSRHWCTTKGLFFSSRHSARSPQGVLLHTTSTRKATQWQGEFPGRTEVSENEWHFACYPKKFFLVLDQVPVSSLSRAGCLGRLKKKKKKSNPPQNTWRHRFLLALLEMTVVNRLLRIIACNWLFFSRWDHEAVPK